MNIDYTVTALMFPAIPLLMSVYSNRFHSLSVLVRQLHDEHVYEKHIPPEWKKQFINLSSRISLLRWTIMFAAFGFLFNMLTVFALYLEEVFTARVIFGSCCLSMIISIIFFIREIQISTSALKLHMSDMDVKIDQLGIITAGPVSILASNSSWASLTLFKEYFFEIFIFILPDNTASNTFDADSTNSSLVTV